MNEIQKDDLEYSQENPIEYVEVSDSLVIAGLLQHSRQKSADFDTWRVKILLRVGELSFPVLSPQVDEHSFQLMA